MTETPVSATAVYTARPTVKVATQEYALLNELLLGMRMTEQDGGMAALELRFRNFARNAEGSGDFTFEDEEILRLGADITVFAGDILNPQEIFRGWITGVELNFPDSTDQTRRDITVLAEDAFQMARMTARTKSYENAKISDIARDFANKLSLRPVITDLDENIGTQFQLNESDLMFLRRLLARSDGDMQVVGEELHVSPRSAVQRAKVTLSRPGQLRSARLLADLAHQTTAVTATGWNPAEGARIQATATGENPGPGAGRTGSTILQDAFGERKLHLGHVTATTTAEIEALANAEFDQRARRFTTVQGVAEGNPQLRVGTHVALDGVGPRFSNTYYVSRVCHRYDQKNGYLTDFEGECAYLGT